MLSAGGGAQTSRISYVRPGWKNFGKLLLLLTSSVYSNKIKGNLYRARARSVNQK